MLKSRGLGDWFDCARLNDFLKRHCRACFVDTSLAFINFVSELEEFEAETWSSQVDSGISSGNVRFMESFDRMLVLFLLLLFSYCSVLFYHSLRSLLDFASTL